jgi:hypothetical protein
MKDAYLLPRTDQCLDCHIWERVVFNVREVFVHQVALNQADADKTDFISHMGMHRYTTMPFGLCNAGATFQRLMDLVMSGLVFEVCRSLPR